MKLSWVKMVNIGALVTSLSLFFLSFWKIIFNSEYLPYLPLALASLLGSLMFTALLIAGIQRRFSGGWTALAILNLVLLASFYYNTEWLREFYPLQLWITLTVIISSIQSLLDRKRKRFHFQMRFLNFGLLLLLIPVYMLRVSSPWIWTVVSVLTLLIMFADLILVAIPAQKGHQSR